jgi:hypothetical protein
MLRYSIPLILVTAGLVASACGSPNPNPASPGIAFAGVGGSALTSPTTIVVGATLTPTTLPLVTLPLAGAGCPAVQPYSTDFNLVINAQTGPLALNQVVFQFVNGASVSGSPVAMSPADLESMFGTTTILPGQTRSFGFQPQFGCGLTLPQTMVLTAFVGDGHGQTQQVTLRAALR